MKKYIQKHIKSQEHAWRGLVHIMRTQMNFDIELAIAMVVIIAGFYVTLKPQEWVYISFCIGAVLSAELLNTSIEHICDAVSAHHSFHIKLAKDMGAGAVLILSLMSAVIGLLIFVPKFMVMFGL